MAMIAPTSSPAVVLPRDLAERLLAGLRARETARGHLAQKVPHEGLGLCSWRSESPQCVAHREVVAAVEGAIAASRQALQRCASCNAPLSGRVARDRRTCSSACRQRAYRRRRAAP